MTPFVLGSILAKAAPVCSSGAGGLIQCSTPSVVKGILVVVCGFILFVGSVYMIVSGVFGMRMGYLVVASAFFGWLLLLSTLWLFGVPFLKAGGQPSVLADLGPRGTEAHWQVFAADAGPTATAPYPVTARYPSHPWWAPAPNAPAAASIDTVTPAIQAYVAQQTTTQLQKQNPRAAPVSPATIQIQDVRFTSSGGVDLAAGEAYLSTGGTVVTVYAYHDHGSVPEYSIGFFFVSLVGFAVHVPLLDRAERRRKGIITSETVPAWYGPGA